VNFLHLKPILLIALICVIVLALQGTFVPSAGDLLGDSWWDGR
jgi:hypothetical protein